MIFSRRGWLVEVAERASAWTARIAAGAATGGRSRRPSGAFSRDRKNTQLWAQLPAFTLGALRLVAAEDQGFKLVLAFPADIFKNRHEDRSRAADCSY